MNALNVFLCCLSINVLTILLNKTCKSVYWGFFFSSYDQQGTYLLAGTSEGHIFVINAKPSSFFKVLGFIGLHRIFINLNHWLFYFQRI